LEYSTGRRDVSRCQFGGENFKTIRENMGRNKKRKEVRGKRKAIKKNKINAR
jgi:hypothetical protein